MGCPPDQVSNFAAAGIALQPQQLAASAAARLCDQRGGPVEVAYGGARMGGKSHWSLSQVGADDCVRHPGLKCLFLRKVGASGKESFEALLPKTIGLLGTYIPSRSLWKCHNGSWIKLGHFQNESDVDKYLGLEYDVIAIEEDTTLSSAKRVAVRSCCRSPEGGGWRARTYSTTNPGGVGHASYKRRFVDPYRHRREKETRFIPATVDDNAFAGVEYREFLDGLTGWQHRAWRHGDWDIAVGQFFTTWRADLHVVPAFDVPPDWDVWLGFDYGFTHYTAVYLMTADGDGNIYAVDEHAERRTLPATHVESIRRMLARNHVEPERIRAVAAGHDVFSKDRNGRTIAEDYADAGLVLDRANNDRINGAGTILKRLGDAERGIPPTLFIGDNCPRLIECIPSLEHDPHRPEDVLKVDTDEAGIGGDDFYDSFRYAVMHYASMREVGYSANPFAGYRG
jgi:phage terminase large subunit